jgi:hypothetical protein
VQPEHLQVAKMIKFIFTGHLNASVNSNPPFPGKERHLLRAQLARITHASQIIPKGLLTTDEETGKEIYAEDFSVPSNPSDLTSLEVWGHQHPMILKVGRITHLTPKGLSEEEKEEQMAKLLAEDPVQEERYTTI